MNPQASKSKSSKRAISGVLLLDKPFGISSNQALQIARCIFVARKAGHTGTLDPAATGLLAICFGEATKFSAALLSADKEYEATLKLGYTSTTGDAEGEISAAEGRGEWRDLELPLEQVQSVFKSFIGVISQTPPMYSALKHLGKRLYSYAREGVEIERQPREAVIHALHMEALMGNEMRIVVKCGTGTYIRTLAEDLGKALGYGGAYLTSLRRRTLAGFTLQQAYTLDALEAMSVSQRDSCLLSTDSLVQGLPAVTLDDAAAASLLQGGVVDDHSRAECSFRRREGQTEQRIRLYDRSNRFLGVGEITEEGRVAPKRLMRQTENS